MNRALTGLAVLGACGDGVTVDEGPGCDVVSREPIADALAVPDGFDRSVDAMIAALAGTFSGTLQRDAGDRPMTLTVTLQGAPTLVRLTPSAASGGIEPAIGVVCTDEIRIDAEVAFASGAAFDTAVGTRVAWTADDVGTLNVAVDLRTSGGDAAPTTFDPDRMARTELTLSARRDDDAWTGEVGFRGESLPSRPGPDGAVSATSEPYGTFTLEP